MSTAEVGVPNLVRIAPLTRCNSKGEVYERTDAVTQQIAAALGLDQSQLRDRLSILNHESEQHLGPECVVFLIRHYHAAADEATVSMLTRGLMKRCAKRIRKGLEAVDDTEERNEAFSEVVAEIFGHVLELASDSGDFLQVRFWVFVDMLTFKARNRGFERLNERAGGEDSEEADELPVRRGARAEIADPGPQPDRDAELQDALKALAPMKREHAEAYVLRHAHGLQIEDQDPNVYTISRHFRKTPRTIRNWLDSAEEAVRRWRERNA